MLLENIEKKNQGQVLGTNVTCCCNVLWYNITYVDFDFFNHTKIRAQHKSLKCGLQGLTIPKYSTSHTLDCNKVCYTQQPYH
jgi:hypothetical protein